jgi:cysteinyl-tRNA synthetase
MYVRHDGVTTVTWGTRVMVVFDVVRRWLRASDCQVTYVRNITDIDDKIISAQRE